MADTDNWARFSSRRLAANSSALAHELLSPERAQKLDLLLHLLANLQQSLVLCGPLGIGKSTLLAIFASRKPDHWTYCVIHGDARLSFETFQRQLLEQCQATNLHDVLTDYAQRARKLVVAIEDAGELVPGLITILCQFAETYPALRLIFVLTPDALHVKLSSDRVLEQCHFIELPALTEQQCETFLQNLSAHRDAPISYRAINPATVQKIYRDSHGIPGKIIVALQRLNDDASPSWGVRPWLLRGVGGVSVLLIGFGIYVLWQQDVRQVPAPAAESSAAPTSVTLALPKPVAPDAAPPASPSVALSLTVPQHSDPVSRPVSAHAPQPIEPLPLPSREPVNLPQATTPSAVTPGLPLLQPETRAIPTPTAPQGSVPVLAPAAPVTDATPKEVANATVAETPPASLATPPSQVVKTQQTPAAPPPAAVATSPKEMPVAENRSFGHSPSAGNAWVIAQPKPHYTLQLLVASQRQGAEQAVRQLGNLPHPVHFVMRQRQGKVDYVVLYGSFATPREAEAAQSALPARWRQAWLRKFDAVQQEVLGRR